MAKAKAAPQTTWRNRIIGHGEEAPDQLLAHFANWRIHPKPQQDALSAVLDNVGWIQDVIVSKNSGRIIDGHLRVSLAISRNEPTIPVVYVDLTEQEELTALATIDPLSAMAATDAAQLGDLLASIETEDAAVRALLEQIGQERGVEFGTGEPQAAPEVDIDRAEELRQKWGVEYGDLWVIPSAHGGEHRILCGDSTKAEDVARVIADSVMRQVVTSPPYTDQREYTIGKFDWDALMNGVTDRILEHADAPCDILINLGLSHKNGAVDHYWSDWLQYCAAQNWPLFGWYVWDKGFGMPGDHQGRLAPSHEFVFHFRKGNQRANKTKQTKSHTNKTKTFRQKDGSLKGASSLDKIGQARKVPDSVIRVYREMGQTGNEARIHPATYSVDFAVELVLPWSDKGDCVFEPFLGSGTTAVACEQTARQCRAIDIEPKYVAVALERLSLMGLTPKRVETGGG